MSHCILTASYEPGFPLAWEGLDLASAEECTPRWYGVSSGNGNDGVSHTWPDYYVRTCEPYRLAELATAAGFTAGEGYAWAIDQVYIDGDSDYTIYATISNPPSDDEPDLEGSMWSDVNGAWHIVEVFPIENMDDERSSAKQYDSLSEAFSADLLALVE